MSDLRVGAAVERGSRAVDTGPQHTEAAGASAGAVEDFAAVVVEDFAAAAAAVAAGAVAAVDAVQTSR
jgi:hypothetical protein